MIYSSMVDFMRDKVGPNWVIARRTPNTVARYGDDVVCLSPARYAALRAEFDDQLRRDATDYARAALDMARELIERMPSGHASGQRSGPEERETHAALVVALRLGREAGLFKAAS